MAPLKTVYIRDELFPQSRTQQRNDVWLHTPRRKPPRLPLTKYGRREYLAIPARPVNRLPERPAGLTFTYGRPLIGSDGFPLVRREGSAGSGQVRALCVGAGTGDPGAWQRSRPGVCGSRALRFWGSQVLGFSRRWGRPADSCWPSPPVCTNSCLHCSCF